MLNLIYGRIFKPAGYADQPRFPETVAFVRVVFELKTKSAAVRHNRVLRPARGSKKPPSSSSWGKPSYELNCPFLTLHRNHVSPFWTRQTVHLTGVRLVCPRITGGRFP